MTTPAAAGSVPVTKTVELKKSVNGSTDPTRAIICSGGAQGNAGRGSVVLTRSAGSPGTITAVITLSTGASAVGREIFLLQSLNGACVAGTTTRIGVWAASPLLGPQTFSGPVLANATGFVILLALSGGAGNDGWSTLGPAILA